MAAHRGQSRFDWRRVIPNPLAIAVRRIMPKPRIPDLRRMMPNPFAETVRNIGVLPQRIAQQARRRQQLIDELTANLHAQPTRIRKHMRTAIVVCKKGKLVAEVFATGHGELVIPRGTARSNRHPYFLLDSHGEPPLQCRCCNQPVKFVRRFAGTKQ